MPSFKPLRGIVVGVASLALVGAIAWWSSESRAGVQEARRPGPRPHLDHSAFFTKPFNSGPEVTKACLECHKKEAMQFRHTPHWEWLGEPEHFPGHEGTMRLGKKNAVNNFCISIQGNWPGCTKCHAGYGWEDANFDFDDLTHMDCLVCHDHSGTYAKTKGGWPRKDADLLAAAKSVGWPTRGACSSCHSYGGGGLAVKHGDLDTTLDNPDSYDDVHMGKLSFTCIDCHEGENHTIRGKSMSVSSNDDDGVACSDCHGETPHADDRLNLHTEKVACQTCHIPTFANSIPTKMWWDWSKAGDDTREDNVHEYLKIKGEFRYERKVVPEYYWFNGTSEHYLAGDKIGGQDPVQINHSIGGVNVPGSKIWPFKVHRGKQIYDPVNDVLLLPVTFGKGGYWHDFDWDKAARLAEPITGIPYSGHYDFIRTEMYWPINHMVQPKEKALRCMDCHGKHGRMDWQALGYSVDPMDGGQPR